MEVDPYVLSKMFEKFLLNFKEIDKDYLKEIKFKLDFEDLSKENLEKVIEFTFKYISKNKETDEKFIFIFSIYFRNVFYKLFGEQFDLKSKIIEKNEHPSVGLYAVFCNNVYVRKNGQTMHTLLIAYLPGTFNSLYSFTHDPFFKGVYPKKVRYEDYVTKLNFYLWTDVKIEE